MRPVLYVGNKNYSGWSLRPWLALDWAGVDFETRVLLLSGKPGYGKGQVAEVLAVSPTGRIPALHVGEMTIWDSLAICEWAAEQSPGLWPRDPQIRAVARSVVAEMHSGFGALRRDLCMNIRRRVQGPTWPEDTQRDVDRIISMWSSLRATHGHRGPWLFGERSVADAFYAPVVTRFRTYHQTLPPVCQAYADTVLADAAMQRWEADAIAESASMPEYDSLYA